MCENRLRVTLNIYMSLTYILCEMTSIFIYFFSTKFLIKVKVEFNLFFLNDYFIGEIKV